jgi:hypothetical protein
VNIPLASFATREKIGSHFVTGIETPTIEMNRNLTQLASLPMRFTMRSRALDCRVSTGWPALLGFGL